MLVSDDGTKFVFEKRELMVLTGMMAGEERAMLAAVWLHGGKAKAWSTDGHRGVMVEREDKPPKGNPNAKPVAVPAATARHVAKTAGPRDVIVFDTSGDEVKIDCRERIDRKADLATLDDVEWRTRPKHASACKPHQGGFDSIDHVFPWSTHRGGTGTGLTVFDPALLPPMLLLGELTGGFVWLSVGGEWDPILFVAKGDDGAVWRVVVMPKRWGGAVPPDQSLQAARSAAAKATVTPMAEPSPAPSGRRRRRAASA